MRFHVLRCLLASAMFVAGGGLRAAEFVATGISIPFFDAAGNLTHRMMAQNGTRAGALQNLRGVEIHYFEPGDPKTIVQKLEAQEATWDDKKETLVGRGPIVVATVENRLTGQGFDFALATSLLHIHRDFAMSNDEVVLTSDRATVELLIEKSGEDVKVRDVKRCEAIGNLHIVTQPAAETKYRFKEAFSDLAIYDGASQMVTLPHPTRLLKSDGGKGNANTLTINLRDEAKDAKKQR